MDAAAERATTESPRKSKRKSPDGGGPAPLPTANVRLPQRRYRQTIQKLDLWSVLKVSLCFYLSGLLMTIVAGVVLWFVADSFNVIHDVERFMGDLLSSKDFKLLSAQILEAIEAAPASQVALAWSRPKSFTSSCSRLSVTQVRCAVVCPLSRAASRSRSSRD